MENTETYTAVVLSENKELQLNLEKENITDLVIVDLKNKYSGLKIAGIADKAGYLAVDEARKEVKRIRVAAEKIVKNETDKAFQAHKIAVADGKKVISRFTEIENSLAEKQKVIDDENERIKLAEKQRKEQIAQDRAKEMISLGKNVHQIILLEMPDADYEKMKAEAIEEKRISDEKIAEEKRLQKEESERIEAQRIEQEKERVRLEKIAANQEAQRLENERIAAAKEKEIADREAKLKADQEAHEKKVADEVARIEKEKLDAEQKAIRDAEIEKQKKEAAELAVQQAEQKRIAAEQAEAKRIADAKAEAAREELLRPDKEKIQLFLQSLSEVKYPSVATGAAREFVEEIENNINLLVNDMSQKINQL